MKFTLGVMIFHIIYFITWVINLVQFLRCDFEAGWKEEIVHALGIFIPYTSFITVWF